jgi:hypothetical protein
MMERTTPDAQPAFPSVPSPPVVIRPSGAEAIRPSGADASGGRSFGTDAALSAVGLPSRRKRSLTAVVVTAAIATLTGVGVMLGVIVMLDRKTDANASAASSHPGATRPPPTITSGIAGASSIPSANGTGSASPPATDTPATASAPPAIAATPSGKAIPARSASGGGGNAKPTATKLDISRDLP